MGVLLQAFYKSRPNHAVPAPVDGPQVTHWWWDRLALETGDLARAGFTAFWLPPVLKANGGHGRDVDGYGPFDDYDIGSKDQMGDKPTRFGTREQLTRLVSIARSFGVDIYLDLVLHQRSGDPGNFIFRYSNGEGVPASGRFPKNRGDFFPNVPRDPALGGPVADDIGFGRELAPINGGNPKGATGQHLIDAAQWLVKSLDVQGGRIDDVKGLSTRFLPRYLNSPALAGRFAVGEFFDGNASLVSNWIFNPNGLNGRASAFDFPLKFQISAMCNNPGQFNMAALDHAGLAGIAPLQAVTFVENHDTDLHSELGTIVINKILGYALILTSEGYPCVYYRDYSKDPNCYGLKDRIDNLIWIHEKIADGPTQQRWKDFNVFAYERLGGSHLLVGLNNDPAGPHTIHVFAGFGANVALHDYTGHAPDVTTGNDGSVTITIPRNNNGLGYVCYSRPGIGEAIRVTPRTTTQRFFGAVDLDIPPAIAGKTVQVGRIWCAINTPIRLQLRPDTTFWTQAAAIRLTIEDPAGATLASRDVSLANTQPLAANVKTAGFHQISVAASNTPPANRDPSFEIECTYTAAPFTQPAVLALAAANAASATQGSWSNVITLPNVPIHTHLLPDRTVLFWGRRLEVGSTVDATLDEPFCQPYLWDPIADPTAQHVQEMPRPTRADKKTHVNLFCSSHTMLADGRLLVAGGHHTDSHGIDQSCVFDWKSKTWTASGTMDAGRWYPTVVTLGNGDALVSSGSFSNQQNQIQNNPNQEIWRDDVWHMIVDFQGIPLYPRMHLAPDGRVFMSGPLPQGFLLDTTGGGSWTPLPGPGGVRSEFREYAASVMYDVGKVIFIGGGNQGNQAVPTSQAEVIDLNAPAPSWRLAKNPMRFARRQHNATILADGTVLVTGGTQGPGFNDLAIGSPIRAAELWDPQTEVWTLMAEESVDRCYHSTATLLPDATVLSAGGGEFRPNSNVHQTNDPKDSHPNAQIFTPPYLDSSRGPRPVILHAPDTIEYGKTFPVTIGIGVTIAKTTLIRLGSTTHSFDQNQRINFLPFAVAGNVVTLTAPVDSNHCPPGYYMLFLLSANGMPSEAKIVRVGAPVIAAAAAMRPIQTRKPVRLSLIDQAMRSNPKGTHVVVGVTPTCPYGLAACWAGAYHALKSLTGVADVAPIPNAPDSTADVYLSNRGLPDLALWPEQFLKSASRSQAFRGVEITLTSDVVLSSGQLVLPATADRPAITLSPLEPLEIVQLDLTTLKPRTATPAEVDAYNQLRQAVMAAGGKLAGVSVTGPLYQVGSVYGMYVRN